MKAEEITRGTTYDLAEWAIATLVLDHDLTSEEIVTFVDYVLDRIENFGINIKSGFSYTNADDIVENGVKNR